MSAPAPLAAAAPASHKRKYHAHSDDIRACALKLHANGTSYRKIEDTTSVPESTVRRWVAQHEAEGRMSKKPRGGSHHVVYATAVREQAVSAQEQDAALRLSDLRQQLHLSASSPQPTLRTISVWLKRAGYTTKRMQPYATKRSAADTKEKRKKWVEDVGSKLTAASAVFVDESPFSMTLMRGCGRSRKGQPAIGVIPAIHGKNHSVIAAISPTAGLLLFHIHVTQPDEEFISKRKGSKKIKTAPKGVTRDVFREFIIDLLAQPFFHEAGQQRTLLFDNARIHLGDISDVIFSAGHVAQHLATWSPELNPIEYAFSTWKFLYRVHYPPDEEAVDPAIRESAASVTPARCQHWFKHTQGMYAACRRLEDL